MPDVCLGVCNSWGKKPLKGRNYGIRGGKKHPYAYFYSEDGKFYRKRVSATEGFKLKLHGIFKKRVFICQVCKHKFLGLIKSKNDVVLCPYCN